MIADLFYQQPLPFITLCIFPDGFILKIDVPGEGSAIDQGEGERELLRHSGRKIFDLVMPKIPVEAAVGF